eukprot:2995119-Amphidinium_carterae.1
MELQTHVPAPRCQCKLCSVRVLRARLLDKELALPCQRAIGDAAGQSPGYGISLVAETITRSLKSSDACADSAGDNRAAEIKTSSPARLRHGVYTNDLGLWWVALLCASAVVLTKSLLAILLVTASWFFHVTVMGRLTFRRIRRRAQSYVSPVAISRRCWPGSVLAQGLQQTPL